MNETPHDVYVRVSQIDPNRSDDFNAATHCDDGRVADLYIRGKEEALSVLGLANLRGRTLNNIAEILGSMSPLPTEDRTKGIGAWALVFEAHGRSLSA